jgi:hypothetical protein
LKRFNFKKEGGMANPSASQLIAEVRKEASRKFASAVTPIYAFVEDRDPVLIGTCFAIEYKNRKFLVTAAHVLDNHKLATLAAGSPSGEFVTIEGHFHVTPPGDSGREDDPWDFAWHELTAEEAARLVCVPETDLETQSASEASQSLYVTIGFPVSKNKKIKPEHKRTRRLAPLPVMYINSGAEASPYFSTRGMSQETHIAIKRENRAFDENGQQENTIGHRGLSGGPLINSGLRLPATIAAQKVSGIVIEGDDDNQRHTIIVAVRLSVVLQYIDAADGSD